MSIPGFTQASRAWQSTVPGWQGDARPESPISVTLDGITVESRPPDARSFRALEALDGWFDGVDARSESILKAGGDGEFEGPVRFGPRSLSVTGSVMRPTRRELLEEMEALGAVLTRPRYGSLIVREPERGLTRMVRVRRAQSPIVRPLSHLVAEFTWLLHAPDPIRWDAQERRVDLATGDTKTVEHVGARTDIPITVRLTGPLVNPSIWIDGHQWRLNRTIKAGETVMAYWRDREVWSAQESLRFFQNGPWVLIPPGMSQVGLSADSGTGRALVSWRSGWL